jgi:sec-independent protein translocase protein TatA
MPIGLPELAVILVILLLIFGPKRLPGLGKQLGTGMREFKDSVTGKDKDDEDDLALPPAPATTPEAAPAAPEPQAEDRPVTGA